MNTFRSIGLKEGLLVGFAVLVLVASVISASVLAEDVVAWLGLFGVGVTIVGVIFTLLIFLNQDRKASSSTESILRAVAQAEETAIHLAQEDAGDEGDSREDDAELEFLAAEKLGTTVGKYGEGVLRLGRDDVPLKMVSELVEAWQVKGYKGNWVTGDLVSVMRKLGRGNHSWYFTFKDPKEGRARVYKLSRGGYGKEASTISEIPQG